MTAENVLKQCVEVLERIMSDDAVPRNIRRSAESVKTILMDEPSMGLSPLLVKEIFDIIVTLRKRGITVLLVEQNAKMALSIADRAYVLETGKITMEGKASDLLHDEKVRKAYLGA